MTMAEQKKSSKKTTNNFKEWNVVLWNDCFHSMEYVVEVLSSVVPDIDKDEAIKHAYLIHTQQKTVVYSGLREHSEHFVDMIEKFEPENKDGKLLPPLAVDIRRNVKDY